MVDLQGLWRRTVSPDRGFRELAAEGPRLGPSLGRLVLLRSPVALLEALLIYLGLVRVYHAFLSMEGPVWGLVLRLFPPELDTEEIRFFLEELPRLPAVGRVLPWLLLLAPLYVLSLWIHDAVWDHGCLWLLGGLGGPHRFQTTLVAESEALQVGVFGAAAGLLTSLPAVGWVLSFPLGIVGAYFWILRGVALAAFHGCPAWKGIVATLLHALLVACLLGGSLLVLFLLVVQGLA